MNRKLPGILVTAAGIIFLVIIFAMKTDIVIYTHYSSWKILLAVSVLILILGMILLSIAFIRERLENARKTETELDREYNRKRAVKLRSAADIRNFYRELNDTPEVVAAFTRLIKQLDEIEELKVKLQRLMEINNLEIFGNTRELLDRIEDYLCGNCRKAVNNYIVDEDDKEELKHSVRLLAEDNSEKLREVRNFLDQLRDYANSQEDDEEAVETLKVYCNTIRKSVSE
ncbi:hypothetical protein QYZ88_002985 [Lachnospiraceae bacterium C1.1]|nr:hypothetical protein [Lachnospiraceae bacterium C1.1]